MGTDVEIKLIKKKKKNTFFSPFPFLFSSIRELRGAGAQQQTLSCLYYCSKLLKEYYCRYFFFPALNTLFS